MTQWIRVLAASSDNLRLSHGPASSVLFLAGEETGATKKFICLRPVVPVTQEEERLSA